MDHGSQPKSKENLTKWKDLTYVLLNELVVASFAPLQAYHQELGVSPLYFGFWLTCYELSEVMHYYVGISVMWEDLGSCPRICPVFDNQDQKEF